MELPGTSIPATTNLFASVPMVRTLFIISLQVSYEVGFFFLPHTRFLLPNCMIHLYLLMGPSKSILNIKTFNGSNSVQLPAALL